MKPTITEIPVDKPGCQRIQIVAKLGAVEISRLGPKDPDGPGNIGIVPMPYELSQRRVLTILRSGTTRHQLVKAALKALEAGTADFFGVLPSRSVVAMLDVPRRSSALSEYKRIGALPVRAITTKHR
jgi:hypothetical protein